MKPEKKARKPAPKQWLKVSPTLELYAKTEAYPAKGKDEDALTAAQWCAKQGGRMPTVTELKLIVTNKTQINEEYNEHDKRCGSIIASWAWSSAVSSGDKPTVGTAVCMQSGQTLCEALSVFHSVLCVRDVVEVEK